MRLGNVFGGLVAIIGNGKARAYLLRNQKELITLVCDEDHLAPHFIDKAENSLRSVALGKTRWINICSSHGAPKVADFMSTGLDV